MSFLQLIDGVRIVGIALAALLSIFVFRKYWRARRRLPPGPKAWPVIGNLLHVIGKLPHQHFQQLAKEYGPLIYLELGRVPLVVVSSPELAKEVLKVQDLAFSSRPKTTAGDVLSYGYQNMVFADVGPHFRRLRRITQFELLSMSRLATFKKIREEENLVLCKGAIEDSQRDGKVWMDVKLQELLVNNITRMTLRTKFYGRGADDSPLGKKIGPLFKEVMEILAEMPIGDFLPYLNWMDLGGHRARFLRVHKGIDDFLTHILEDRRSKLRAGCLNLDGEVQDFLDLLISLSGPDELTNAQIKAFFGDVLAGGSDTVSNTIGWTMVELLRNPQVKKRVQDELDSVVGPDRMVQEDDIANLQYLQAVLKESMRLHPVAGLMIPHETIQDSTLAGYHIPKGARVLVNSYAIHRDPAYWERPLEFDPERFLSMTKDGMKILPESMNFRYLPFGSGRRMCPGMNWALLMVPFSTAQLLHCCDWSLPHGEKPEAMDMSESFGLTIPRKAPLNLVATPRLPLLRAMQQQAD